MLVFFWTIRVLNDIRVNNSFRFSNRENSSAWETLNSFPDQFSHRFILDPNNQKKKVSGFETMKQQVKFLPVNFSSESEQKKKNLVKQGEKFPHFPDLFLFRT